MSFLVDYQKLFKSVPHPALTGGRNENVEFCDSIWHSYNTYYSFDSGRLKDCAYMYNCTGANYQTFCVDCFDCYECNSCELCYECFVAHNCYNSSFLEYCNQLSNCHYCIHCRNSKNLFGCVELEYKEYCIFNVQYTKDIYEQKLKELKEKPPTEILQRVEKLRYLLPQQPMRITRQSENSFGDYIINCKNSYSCFFATECEDGAYLFDAQFSKDCFDCSGGIHMSELCYECPDIGQGIGHSYNCSYASGDYLTDCHYCNNCLYSQNLFGCVNLNKARFCILNKQYSEKDYWQKVAEIKKELGWKK